MLKLKNKYLTAKICEDTGVMLALCEGEKEIIVKRGDDIILRKNGEDLDMSDAECTLGLLRKNFATFNITTSECTLSMEYILHKKQLIVKQTLQNTGEDADFALGIKNGVATPDTYKYDLLFSSKQTIGGEAPILFLSKALPVCKEYFTNNILLVKPVKFSKVILRNRTDGSRLRFNFPCAEELMLKNDREGILKICAVGKNVRLKSGKKHTQMYKLTALPIY